MKYILSLDQGTTSSRSLLVNEEGKIVKISQKEFTQIFPKPSWVEHNPIEIWNTQLETIKEAISEISLKDISAIAITNQRETVVAFDSETGKPVANAIVWQCRRTASYCDELKKSYKGLIKKRTGLEVDAYFSASKMKWILENIPEAVELKKSKRLRFGTIDSWLVWNLTGGKSFTTDPSNACRTMLFSINEGKYDSELLKLFNIEEWMLPKVLPSNGDFGICSVLENEIPIKAILGDQQAALFGQCCFKKSELKVTYGTGGFLLVNTGDELQMKENLISTIAWQMEDEITYAIEGSIFISGSVIHWLRDGIKIIEDAKEAEKISLSINSNEGVYLVPAFVGLGAPYWNQDARGIITGITRGTQRAHFIRAAVESMAYQVADIVLPLNLSKDAFVKVDGGATKNNFLLQFQSDLLGLPVMRSAQSEATALGVAYMAGLSIGFWKSKEELSSLWRPDELFTPRTNRAGEYSGWKKAVEKTLL